MKKLLYDMYPDDCVMTTTPLTADDEVGDTQNWGGLTSEVPFYSIIPSVPSLLWGA